MPITKDDIKLLESERMTDNADGGGRVTGKIILDGKSNNIFPDISELDRIYGRVNMRKIYPAVYTTDQDSYYGSMLILDKVPADEKVDALLFDTDDWNDERANAQNKIESYVVRGPMGPWFLYERQLEGQRSILLFATLDAPLPDVGEVVYLVENEDQPDEFSQYCRITKVESEIKTFTIGGECKTFQRKIITLSIANPLAYTFDGASINCMDNLTPPAVIRTTQVADAAKYWGTMPLAEPAAPGDITVKLDSVYAAIVPSTRGETPILDTQPGGDSAFEITSGTETFRIVSPANTGGIEVSLANRATNYTYSCVPVPGPGALVVEYRSLGKWYSLRDDGTGALVGDGTGLIDYSTGSVQVTLLALPDVGSEILFTWSSTVHYTDRAGSTGYDTPVVRHTLATPAEPGSVNLSWLEGGATKTATVNSDGGIDGDATGFMIHGTGEIEIVFNAMPDANSQLEITYNEVTNTRETFTGLTPAGSMVNFTLASQPKPGSVKLAWRVERGKEVGSEGKIYTIATRYMTPGVPSRITYQSGSFQKTNSYSREVMKQTQDSGNGYIAGDASDNFGTVDYGTGDIALKVTDDVTIKRYNGNSGVWTGSVITETFATQQVTVDYIDASASTVPRTETIDIPPLRFSLVGMVQDEIVPGTVRITVGGTKYSDRAGLGALYLDDGTVAGSVEYKAGMVQLDVRPSGLPSVTISSLVTSFGMWDTYEYRYRTPGAPLQPGSLTQNGTTQDGTMLTLTGDLSGVIDETFAHGSVDHEQGVVRMRYGALVPDSSLTPEEKNEDWYDPADIDANGNIWKPIFVYPNTVRFNCVVYTFLPLDADVLGLDPVRLPSDGRVPIFRPADVVVIHNTAEIVEQNPSNGQVIDCGRVRLERVTITDADGAVVTYMDTNWTTVTSPSNGQTVNLGRTNLYDIAIRDADDQWVSAADYTEDLAAGTVTLTNVAGYAAPLYIRDRVTDYTCDLDAGTVTLTNIAGYTAPLTIAHRISDKALASDVQIDGRVTLTAQITHNYPDGTSWVSSAMIIGDLASRWANLFEQETWTGEWSDDIIGDEPLASYDSVTYPMEVDNRGCLQERWAIIFTNTNTFKLVGEHVGQIAVGDITNDFSPTNPNVGRPYFTIKAAGWGSGWATGNVLRFNTVAANHPAWLARCIQQGDATAQDDGFCIGILGDVNT